MEFSRSGFPHWEEKRAGISKIFLSFFTLLLYTYTLGFLSLSPLVAHCALLIKAASMCIVFWTSRKKDPFYGPLPDFHFPHCRPFFVLLGDITRM